MAHATTITCGIIYLCIDKPSSEGGEHSLSIVLYHLPIKIPQFLRATSAYVQRDPRLCIKKIIILPDEHVIITHHNHFSYLLTILAIYIYAIIFLQDFHSSKSIDSDGSQASEEETEEAFKQLHFEYQVLNQ